MAAPESGAIAIAAKRQRLSEQAHEAAEKVKAASVRAKAARTEQMSRSVAAAAKTLRQQRLHFAAKATERRRTQALAEVPKGFDASDLGQGREDG